MKNSQEGFIVPLLLAIIAILAIGGGTYFYLSNKAEIGSAPVANSPANTESASSSAAALPTTSPDKNVVSTTITASYIAPFEKELTRCQSLYGKASFCDISTGYINAIKNCLQFKGKENEDRLKTCLFAYLIPSTIPSNFVDNSSTLSTFTEVNNDTGSYDLICSPQNAELSAKDYINKNYILLYTYPTSTEYSKYSGYSDCYTDLQKERVHLCKDINTSKYVSCVNGINKYGGYVFPNKEMMAAINSLDNLLK